MIPFCILLAGVLRYGVDTINHILQQQFATTLTMQSWDLSLCPLCWLHATPWYQGSCYFLKSRSPLAATRPWWFLFLLFTDEVSLWNPGCPWTHRVHWAGHKLRASLPVSSVLRLKARATTVGYSNFFFFLNLPLATKNCIKLNPWHGRGITG